MHKNKKGLAIGLIVIALLLTAMLLSRFFYQFMLIQGDSMKPTYHNLSLVVIDKHDKKYNRGDVIAFRCDGVDGVLVKRIAGLPGDSLRLEAGRLYVNGSVSTVYDASNVISYAGILEQEIILSSDEYFVLGDNLEESIDSRYTEIGLVRYKDVIGKVCFPSPSRLAGE